MSLLVKWEVKENIESSLSKKKNTEEIIKYNIKTCKNPVHCSVVVGKNTGTTNLLTLSQECSSHRSDFKTLRQLGHKKTAKNKTCLKSY